MMLHKRTMSTPARYTIRLTDAYESTYLIFDEEVESERAAVAVEAEKDSKQNGGCESSCEGITRRTSRRVSVLESTRATAVPKTRRRKRKDALSLSEASAAFKNANDLVMTNRVGDDSRFRQASSTPVKYALARVIQPGDVLETIESLGRIKFFDCKSVKVDVRTTLNEGSNYPINLTFVRQPQTFAVHLDTGARKGYRGKRSRSGETTPVLETKEATIISLCSEDEGYTAGSGDAIPSSASFAEASHECMDSSALMAHPDPIPGFQAGDFVLTPVGPGVVTSHRIDRWSDNLDDALHPVVQYQVSLPFGTLNAPSRHVKLLEGSPFAKERIPNCPLITQGDLVRLQPHVYLNDNLVTFYLTYLQQRKGGTTSRVHMFSSHFYTAITDAMEAGQRDTPAFRTTLWENLKHWTKKVNIWNQDLLFIPIHGGLHWSVAVVCHPTKLLPREDDPSDECIPCLLHLDSGKKFRLHRSAIVFRHVSMFLTACLEQGNDTLPFAHAAKKIPTISPLVPVQPNDTDCGVYMLEWIERLLNPPFKVSQDFVNAKGCMPPFGKGAFTQDVIDGKRHELLSLVYSLSRGQAN